MLVSVCMSECVCVSYMYINSGVGSNLLINQCVKFL